MAGGGAAPQGVAQQSGAKEGAGSSNISPMPTMATPMQQAPQQAMPQQRLSPQVAQQQFAQQRMMPQQAMPQYQGLQMLLNNMLSRYQPQQAMQQRAFMPMPTYQNQALQYRPDMGGPQQNLNRVAKSVVLQQKEAAEAELAAMREAEAARAAQEQYNNTYAGA